MSISKPEYKIRLAEIDALQSVVDSLQEDIYNKKANILKIRYGAKMEACGMSYTDNSIELGEEVFFDVDDALEYAEEHLCQSY